MQIKFDSKRAVSPIVSTLLLMVITMMALSLTLGYTQNTLTRKNGETDFETAKSFMRNLGLQVDDVAWIKGRVDTVHITSQYGQIEYVNDVVQYKIDFIDNFGHIVGTKTINSDIFMYNIPTEKYYLEEGYYSEILGSVPAEIVSMGVDAPVARVFAAQSNIVGGAQFLRVVMVPVLRVQTYNVTSSGSVTRYCRIFIPDLQPGYSSTLAKSVVLTGLDVKTEIYEAVTRVDISVTFPQLEKNYDNNFFRFGEVLQNIQLTGSSNVEVYSGQVRLDYGA